MLLKKLALICLLCAISICAWAIPAKQGIKTFTQADGTSISLQLIGDENFHTLVTSDGLAVKLESDGNYHYRTATGVSKVVAHNIEKRSASEISFINNYSDDIKAETLVKAAVKSGAVRARSQGPARVATQVPNNGSPKVPVLLVQYSDVKFKDSDPKSTFESFFSSGSTSAYQYFVDQSNGLYTPEFDVYGPVTLSGTRATYGGNDSGGSDVGVGTMVAEACQGLDSSIDFSQYDNNSDKACDVVIVLYAGVGEASSGVDDSVWPCQWNLYSSDYGKNLTLDKVTVSKFAVFNELNGSSTSKIDGIGTFCHEFSHCMGLPDFYDVNYSGYFGMGPWSLMDYGSYNNDGYTPCGYSAYEKSFMGWISLEEGVEDTQYTLPVFNQKDASTDKAIKITNASNSNEYYILENRAQQGWDKYFSAEGMMITHVYYNSSAWTNNTVNTTSTQRMTIIPADNELKMSGSTIVSSSLAGDLWPYKTYNELTNTSTPAATVYSGTYMNKPVTQITKNSDGTISFWFMKSAAKQLSVPSNLSASVEGTSSATISWQADDIDGITYTLDVTKHRDAAESPLVETDFTTGSYGGWTKSGSTEISSTDGVKLGASKNAGSITSPEFTSGASGTVTVKFTAKYYGTDESTITVALSTGASTTVALNADYTEHSVVLAGTADTATKVSITASSKQRAYIKYATIYDGDKSSAPARVTESSTTYTRTFSGITTTSYQVTGLEENTLYDYRVRAISNDEDKYVDSDWSEYSQFTTEEGEIVVRQLAAPKSLAAKVESTSSATLSWEAGENLDATYSIQLLKDGDTTPTTFTDIAATSKLVENLTAEASYQFRVMASPADTERYSDSDWSEYASFNLEDGIVIVAMASPINASAKVNSISSATISWQPGDSNAATYTLELTKQVETPPYELVADYSFASGAGTWTTGGFTTNESSSMRLGSGSKTGSLTSPDFTTNDSGKVTVKFNAKYYGTDGSSVKVSLLSGSSYSTTSSSETIALTDAYSDYYIVLDSPTGASVKVKFETLASSKRVYIASASLYKGDASSLASAVAAKVQDVSADGVRTISGIEETSITLNDLEEEASYSYRVMASPTDTKHFSESAWTEAKEFTLEGDIVVTEVAAPTDLAVTDITANTANLSWTAGDDTDVTFSVEISKADSDATPTVVSGISDTSYSASGLDSETSYEFRVKAVPTDSKHFSDSEWSAKTSFTTTVLVTDLVAPKDPSATVESPFSATISWTPGSDVEQTFTLQLTEDGSDSPTIIENLTETSYLAENLTEGAVYTYRIMAVPVDTKHYNASEWSVTATFDLKEKIEVVTATAPSESDAAKISATSVTIYWPPTEGYEVTYSLELTKQLSYELVSSTSFTSSSHGWTTSSSGIGTPGSTNGIQVGSSKSAGTITSPSFNTTDYTTVTVVVNTKYNDSSGKLTVKLTNSSGTDLASTEISPDSVFKDFYVPFDCTANTDVKVAITAAKNNRKYVKRVDIYRGTYASGSSVAAKAPSVTTSGNVILVEGIEENVYTLTDLEAGSTYDYRVKVVPVDSLHYAESDWSELKSFTLDGELTSIFDPATALPDDAVYYTLQGIRLANAPTSPGIYIKVSGQNSQKLIIR